MSLKKSYICIFFHSFWKNLHLTENFYTDMSVVSVTNMRYGQLFIRLINYDAILKKHLAQYENKIATDFEPKIN